MLTKNVTCPKYRQTTQMGPFVFIGYILIKNLFLFAPSDNLVPAVVIIFYVINCMIFLALSSIFHIYLYEFFIRWGHHIKNNFDFVETVIYFPPKIQPFSLLYSFSSLKLALLGQNKKQKKTHLIKQLNCSKAKKISLIKGSKSSQNPQNTLNLNSQLLLSSKKWEFLRTISAKLKTTF